MPVGEVTEIFSYFRSQPLDRLNSRPGGIDSILIGTWEEIKFREKELRETYNDLQKTALENEFFQSVLDDYEKYYSYIKKF